MQFICTKCGHTEPVTTRRAHCECGGLWDLDFQPPAFTLDAVDHHPQEAAFEEADALPQPVHGGEERE